MENQEVKYVPFTNTDELQFHLDASKALIDRIKSMVELFDRTEGEMREELEATVTNSIHVLVDCFSTFAQSIEQGYVK
jgi:hypothetical protein